MKGNILIIDDEKHLADVLRIALEEEGYRVFLAYDPETGIRIFEEERIDLVISDIRMQNISGLDLLKKFRAKDPDALVILMTAYSSIESVIEALRGGAVDYLMKPFEIDELLFRVKNALNKKHLTKQVYTLREEKLSELNLIGKSEAIAKIKEFIDKVSQVNTTVLIYGESGTGKELVAQLIHYKSNRPGKFVPVNCAAIPDNLIESELFGYKKGAFTGASSDKIGYFKLADSGTLFLDEISEFPLHLQPKLLRAIQNQEFLPLGSTKPEKVDVRIISATNRNLEEEVKAGKFREDLFYRLNVVPIEIPPLRKRREDIPLLIEFFIKKLSKRLKIKEKTFTKEAVDLMTSFDWPGNVRELENFIERICVLEKVNIIDEDVVKRYYMKEKNSAPSITGSLKKIENEAIKEALKQAGGNKIVAARILGIHPSTLYRKLKKRNLDS
ncbi:hypothetical protein DRQ17_01190 [bacterium]|nr:MAG: hypothetical protein DRQ17_01190 [bacterium]